MNGPGVDILPHHDFSLEEVDRLEDYLYEHNRAAVGRSDGRGLGFVALAGAAQVGAAAGYSWAGMAELKQLWVDPHHRGRGLGRRLVEAFVAEARTRGCEVVWVMTYEFQALWLYERCGFEQVVELEGWPPGHSHHVLKNSLAG